MELFKKKNKAEELKNKLASMKSQEESLSKELESEILKGNPVSVGVLPPAVKTQDKKPITKECLVLKPYDDGGSKKQRMDLSGIDLSKSRWMWNGVWIPLLVLNRDKENVLRPFVREDVYSTTASAMYDANNPSALHNCWRKKRTMLQKLAIGVMAALAAGLFLILFLMMKQGA